MKELIQLFSSIMYAYWAPEENGGVCGLTGTQMSSLLTSVTPTLRSYKIPVANIKQLREAIIDGKINDDEKAVAVYEFATAMRPALAKMEQDSSIPRPMFMFIKGWVSFIRNGNEKTLDTLTRHVDLGGDQKLAAKFIADIETVEVENQDTIQKMRALVKKLTGKPDLAIDPQIAPSIKAKNPDAYKQYLAIRKQLVDNFKRTLMSIVRSSGKPHLPTDKVAAILDKKKIAHNIPKDFSGQIDEDGKYYTKWGEQLNGTPIGKVEMNPAYKAGSTNWVCKVQGPFSQGAQYVFTLQAVEQKRGEKFSKVGKFIEKFDSLSKKWRAALNGSGKDKLIGAMIETVYLTQGRIGGQGMTAGEKTFGISTLLNKQVKANAQKVRMAYVGKKGMKQVHEIHPSTPSAKKVIQIINKLKANKGPNDKLWQDESGLVTAQDVNTFLKGIGSPITIHKFRTVRGSILMKELLAQKDLGKKPDPKTVLAYFKKCSEMVGTELGHMNKSPLDGSTKVTGNTAVKNYIDPSVMLEYFDRYGVRPPVVVEQLKSDNGAK